MRQIKLRKDGMSRTYRMHWENTGTYGLVFRSRTLWYGCFFPPVHTSQQWKVLSNYMQQSPSWWANNV